MRNILLLVNNTLKLLLRRKGNLVFILLSIFIPIIFLTFNLSSSSKLVVGVVNKDNGILSKDMMSSLRNSGKFSVVDLNESNLDRYVTKGDVDCALIVPKDFSENIIENKAVKVQIVSIKGKEIALAIQNYVNQYISNLKYLSLSSNDNRDMFYKMYQEYENNSLIKLSEYSVKDKSAINNAMIRSIGFFIMFLMMGASGISELMLQEKRDKTFYRICAAPIKSRTYVFSNFIVNAAVTLFQIIMIMLFLMLFLKLPVDKSFVEAFIVLLIFGLSSIGLGMLITTFSDSTVQSGGLTSLIVTPTCMLGGVFWPVEYMPKVLQKISDFIPQKWAIDAITKIEETSNPNILLNIAILLAYALAFILIAAYRMKISDKTADFV